MNAKWHSMRRTNGHDADEASRRGATTGSAPSESWRTVVARPEGPASGKNPVGHEIHRFGRVATFALGEATVATITR